MAYYNHKRRVHEKKEWGVTGDEAAGSILLEVVFEENDTVEKLIKRFLKKFKKNKLMDEIHEHNYYVKPSMRRKLKRSRRRKVAQRIQQEKDLSNLD
jgi:small subunit ribosomal protein S21